VDTWNNSLFQLINHIYYFEAEFLPFYIKLIPFIFSIAGVSIAILVYNIYEKKFIIFSFYKKIFYIYSFFIKKWYFDIIYNNFIIKNILQFGYNISFKILDRGLFELLGPLGIVRSLTIISKKISNLQTGLIYHYAFMIILGVTFIILLFILPIYLKSGLLVVYFYIYIYLNIKNYDFS
jgi:NADH-ubiquinone oxidoreductase chain 5